MDSGSIPSPSTRHTPTQTMMACFWVSFTQTNAHEGFPLNTHTHTCRGLEETTPHTQKKKRSFPPAPPQQKTRTNHPPSPFPPLRSPHLAARSCSGTDSGRFKCSPPRRQKKLRPRSTTAARPRRELRLCRPTCASQLNLKPTKRHGDTRGQLYSPQTFCAPAGPQVPPPPPLLKCNSALETQNSSAAAGFLLSGWSKNGIRASWGSCGAIRC